MLMGGFKPDDHLDISAEQDGLFKLKNFINSNELNQFMEQQQTIIINHKKNKFRNMKIAATTYFSDSDEELGMEEDQLDQMYAAYKEKRGIRDETEERKLVKDVGLGSDDEFNDETLKEINENEQYEEFEGEQDIDIDMDEQEDENIHEVKTNRK